MDKAAWYLWLVTGDYKGAPQQRDDNEINEGTAAPISSSFKSTFEGKTPEECAAWLIEAPKEVDLNRQYFAVMDMHSWKDNTTTMCRIKDDGNVKYYPGEAQYAAMDLLTSDALYFEERLESYQGKRRWDKKPDLSKGEPYDDTGAEE